MKDTKIIFYVLAIAAIGILAQIEYNANLSSTGLASANNNLRINENSIYEMKREIAKIEKRLKLLESKNEAPQ